VTLPRKTYRVYILAIALDTTANVISLRRGLSRNGNALLLLVRELRRHNQQ
jgi:hypothetical protein